MRQVKTIYVDANEAKEIDRLLKTQPKTEEQCFGEDDTTHNKTALFDNGIEVDVKLCGVQYVKGDDNRPWTEAVLFKNGSEVTCTEPSDGFFGKWSLEMDGNTYIVHVERGTVG